jgi:hypothetical protein
LRQKKSIEDFSGIQCPSGSVLVQWRVERKVSPVLSGKRGVCRKLYWAMKIRRDLLKRK